MKENLSLQRQRAGAGCALAPQIADLGMRVAVAPTVMHNEADRVALAEVVLGFCATLLGEAEA